MKCHNSQRQMTETYVQGWEWFCKKELFEELEGDAVVCWRKLKRSLSHWGRILRAVTLLPDFGFELWAVLPFFASSCALSPVQTAMGGLWWGRFPVGEVDREECGTVDRFALSWLELRREGWPGWASGAVASLRVLVGQNKQFEVVKFGTGNWAMCGNVLD